MWSANAGSALPLLRSCFLLLLLFVRSWQEEVSQVPPPLTLREERHLSAHGAPSDRRQNRWVSQSEAESSFHPHLYQTHLPSSTHTHFTHPLHLLLLKDFLLKKRKQNKKSAEVKAVWIHFGRGGTEGGGGGGGWPAAVAGERSNCKNINK